MDFGIASVAAITVIAYLIGQGCKASEKISDSWIGIVSGLAATGVNQIYKQLTKTDA